MHFCIIILYSSQSSLQSHLCIPMCLKQNSCVAFEHTSNASQVVFTSIHQRVVNTNEVNLVVLFSARE